MGWFLLGVVVILWGADIANHPDHRDDPAHIRLAVGALTMTFVLLCASATWGLLVLLVRAAS